MSPDRLPQLSFRAAQPPGVVAIAQPANLGDVVSCMPMAGLLKRRWPETRVLLIGRPYTRPLVEACDHFDGFVDMAEVIARPALLADHQVRVFLNPFLVKDLGLAAKAAGVPIRVGNLRRPRTLAWANRFIYQDSRRNPLHQANMNLRHLRPLGIRAQLPLKDLSGLLGLRVREPLRPEYAALLDPQRFNLILHPKTHKNGREWHAEKFNRLIDLLPPDRFRIFITGRGPERDELQRECCTLLSRPEVVDLIDTLDTPQLLAFIDRCDGLVSNGTGPLHIAAALGIHALGLFPGRARSNAQKWHPIGERAEAVSFREHCKPGPGRCPMNYSGQECSCMTGIDPEVVAQRVMCFSRCRAAGCAP